LYDVTISPDSPLKATPAARIFSFGKKKVPMETILLIEHDPALLVAVTLLLRSFGYRVLEAGSRGEAWRACHRYPAPIHLVLTKAIPDKSSTSEFVSRLQLVHPQIRAALFVPEASPPKLTDMPCEYAVLHKPLRAEDLADTIRGLLEDPKRRAASFLS
jgi:DNA-binding NtrC family response regulator